MAPSSSFSLPFLRLPLPHPFLLTSFGVNLVSPEAFLASSEAFIASSKALSYLSIAFLFNNSIAHSLSIHPPFNGIIGDSYRPLLEIFSFGFFKIRFTHFGKPFSSTRFSTVFLGVSAFVRRLNLCHPTPTCRSVGYTRLRVDLTRRRVALSCGASLVLHRRLIHLRLWRSSILRCSCLACYGFCLLNFCSFFFCVLSSSFHRL